MYLLKRPGETPERIDLGDELKSGGAGSIYSIKDDASRVIKLYHAEISVTDRATYREKIECMLENAPNVPEINSAAGKIIQLAWPLASAYTLKGEFVGFAMPVVDLKRTIELEFILSHKQAEKCGLPHHLGVGVSLAHNLSAIVSSIHARGHAIVDLKPVNLKFYIQDFFIAVLDCDGFYVNLPGKKASAPQVTPDYVAPEFQNSPITKPEHQDRFALAVIIFKLLNFGIHPYACVAKKDADIPSDLEEKIKAGLYPYGINSHPQIGPVPASVHETFPSELRSLFDRAFEGNPSLRPNADEWATVLRRFAERTNGLLDRCSNNHLHFKGMPCASCLRDQVLGHAIQKKQKQQVQRSYSNQGAPAPIQTSAYAPAHQAPSRIKQPSFQSRLLGRIGTFFFEKVLPIWFIIALIAGFYSSGRSFWIASGILAIPLFRVTKKGQWNHPVIAAFILGACLAWPALFVFHLGKVQFYGGEHETPTNQASKAALSAKPPKQILTVDVLTSHLYNGNLALANEKFHLAISEHLAKKHTAGDSDNAYGRLLEITVDLANHNIAQGRIEDAQKILIEASEKLLSSKVVAAQSSPSSSQFEYQIPAILASTYWVQKKYREAIVIARRTISNAAYFAEKEVVQSVNDARVILAKSLLMTNQLPDAAMAFNSAKLDLVPEQDKALLQLLTLASNTLADNYSDPDAEAKGRLADYPAEKINDALEQIKGMSSGTPVESNLVQAAERLALAGESGRVEGAERFALASEGERVESTDAWMGIALDKNSEQGDGLTITHVDSNSPAERAGIKSGDRLLEINGKSVKAMDIAQLAMAKLKEGQVIPVKVEHEGKSNFLIVKIGKKP